MNRPAVASERPERGLEHPPVFQISHRPDPGDGRCWLVSCSHGDFEAWADEGEVGTMVARHWDDHILGRCP